MTTHLAAQVAHARRLGIAQRRRAVPRSQPPTLIESDYAHRLVGIVDQLRSVVRQSTSHLRFDDSRARQARLAVERARQAVDHGVGSTQLEGLAYDFGRRVSVHQRNEFQRQAKAAIGIDVTPIDPQIASLVDGFVHENVALVQKLQGGALDDLGALLTRAAANGLSGDALAEQIEARFGIAERHARLIARDQITRLESRLWRARCTEIGIASYDWISMLVGKSRRPEHVARHGKRFRYDSPPADGQPGMAILCCCRQQPAWDELRAAVDAPRWQAVLR